MQKKRTAGNKAILAVSYIVAIIMWLSVTVFINPESTRSINGVSVTMSGGIAMLDSMGLSIVDSSAPEVKIEVKGNRIDLSRLTADDFTVTPKFSGINKAGAYTLELTAVANDTNLEVLSVSPKNINITVARMDSVTLPLTYRVVGDVPDGYFLESVTLSDESVKVSGPAETVSGIAAAVVMINEPKNGSENLPIVFLDKNGSEVSADSLEKSISTAATTVTLFKTKTVTLTAELTGLPSGIEQDSVMLSVTPNTLTLKGPEQIINGIADIYSVAQISLSSVIGSETREIELVLPVGVQTVDGTSSVDVDIAVKDGIVTRYIDVRAIKLSEYLQGFNVTVLSAKVRNVCLVGTAEIIDQITAEDLVATVIYDTTDIPQKGSYSMKVKVSSVEKSGFWISGEYDVNVKVA